MHIKISRNPTRYRQVLTCTVYFNFRLFAWQMSGLYGIDKILCWNRGETKYKNQVGYCDYCHMLPCMIRAHDCELRQSSYYKGQSPIFSMNNNDIKQWPERSTERNSFWNTALVFFKAPVCFPEHNLSLELEVRVTCTLFLRRRKQKCFVFCPLSNYS